MTKTEFLNHLQEASYQALKCAEHFVKTGLKSNFRYNVIFEDAKADPKMKLSLSDKDVVDLLYINGEIPIWININVLKSSKIKTTFNLLCSEDYSEKREDFYYNENSNGPFVVNKSNSSSQL